MKKKLTVVALVVVLVALLISGMTMAYFTDTKSVTNVFTVGNIDIELTEPNWNAAKAAGVLPGGSYLKDPTVENTGDADAYVLIEITFNGNNSGRPVSDFLVGLDKTNFDVITDTPSTLLLHAKEKLEPDSTLTAFTAVQLPTDLVEGDLADEFHIVVVAKAIQADGFDSAAAAFDALAAQENGSTNP